MTVSRFIVEVKERVMFGCDSRRRIAAGVSLVEVLVYIVLLSLLSMVLFQGATRIQARLHTADKKNSLRMGLYAAADSLTRDLRRAPTQTGAWKVLGPSRLWWRTEHVEIEWYSEQGKLYRAQKSYHRVKKVWGDRAVSLVAYGIARVSFDSVVSIDEAAQIACIMFMLNSLSDQQVQGVVALRNRGGA